MASDEYRPPWLPVNPVPEPAETSDKVPEAEPDPVAPAESEAQPAPEPAAEREVSPAPSAPAPEAAPLAARPTASPFAPMPSPTPTLTPTPTPSSTYAPSADPSEAVTPTGSSPSPAAAAAFFGARGDRAATQREPAAFEPAPAFVPPPAFEPWQTSEPAPPAPETPSPAAPPTPQPPAIRTSPYLSGSLPVTDHGDVQPEVHASAQDSWAPTTRPSPPLTGSVPTVRADDLTPTKPQVPHSAHSAAPTPTPTAAPKPEPEPQPAPTADSILTPIEADEDEIIAPILPPPDMEIMPRAGDDESNLVDAPEQGTTAWSPTSSPETPGERDSSPAPTDSVRQLGASAVSNASLQAAGAPTPTTGVPRVPEYEDVFPSFGDEEPFVPRFEPSTSATPPQTPSVSFAEPAPRSSSPLSDLDIPETDEPAYTPRVELSSWPSDEPGPTRVPLAGNAPVVQNAPAFTPPSESAPATPSRPWSAVRDDDVEFAAPTIHPGSGLPAEMAAEMAAERESDALVHSTDPKDSTVTEPTEPRLPITPRRAVTDSAPVGGPPSDAPAAAPDLESEHDAESATGERDVAATAPRKRKRWIRWLIIALLVASAAGFLIYRMSLLPDPIALPVPTVTASPASPAGEPITIADPTDFVGALPDTVETNVLMGYESIDPLTESDLPARLAEHDTLSYGTGTGTPDFVVNAYQHYNVEDAQTAYDSWAAGTTGVEPVLVDGEQVGERAVTQQGVTSTVVWRNVTAVFVLTGPAESVLDFYEHYGV